MKRLTGVAELLDGPLNDPAALTANLRDLALLNRLTFGPRLSSGAIAALGALGEATSVVDVGTGGADIPVALLAAAHRAGRPLTVAALDSRPEVLAAARAARPSLARVAGLELAVADGRSLPFPDGAFDVAHASLVLHHLERDEAVTFLREMARVARRGIVVNDLVRSRLAWAGAWVLVRALLMSRYTRHDGPLSIRRAWSRAEMVELLGAAGLEVVAVKAGPLGHRIAIAARRAGRGAGA